MSDIAKKMEAILFAVGRAISEQELSELSKHSVHEVHTALEHLKTEYHARESPLLIIQEGDAWKLTVHEKYLPIVQQINPHTELSKTILETLAVIAWKQPATQSEVIRIRTNKAYEHIDELERLGFISKDKYGRSYILKVTQKFFDYFDLPGNQGIKAIFKDVKDVGEAQAKLADVGESKELGFEVYHASEKDKHEAAKEHIGELEVFEDVHEEAPEETEDENPVETFLDEHKAKPAPQEVEETEETEVSAEEKHEEASDERKLDPELEDVAQGK
ncbi:MAG TPA: SMC-Scp complex subunit ScpB [Candidatus Nanoarchaeia archaeon]|nr:SMC-Scp complex subunit ScpB [Candidatus Nanoarchaeia archaeon]